MRSYAEMLNEWYVKFEVIYEVTNIWTQFRKLAFDANMSWLVEKQAFSHIFPPI